MKHIKILFLVLCLSACIDQPDSISDAEAVVHAPVLSLTGKELLVPDMPPERTAKLTADFERAKAEYTADPMDADNVIWLGRRAGYLWDYQGAIAYFSEGIDKFPSDPRMYRHRGHRYISIRMFEEAEADLKKAAELMAGEPDEIEPDGAPNPAGIPTSSLHTNVWYHLGLAHYVQGEFEDALQAYEKCLEASKNNDMDVATLDWYYMTLQRLGRTEEAKALLEDVDTGMELLENHSYLKRIKLYKGEIPPDSLLMPTQSESYALDLATQGYGVGNWYLYNGEEDEAKKIFEQVVAGEYWAAFGYIAAEAELVRR
ncbi:MAG: tetratricopeptide repeat protein [Rhodothermaceae bacterium]|nr:tetratricopeptide repeat protein [Rhodothermaceae bacterium]